MRDRHSEANLNLPIVQLYNRRLSMPRSRSGVDPPGTLVKNLQAGWFGEWRTRHPSVLGSVPDVGGQCLSRRRIIGRTGW